MSYEHDEHPSKVVSEFQKSGGEVVRINLIEWKQQTFFDIRTWFPADDGTFRPSAKGIRLNGELIEDLISALQRAQAQLEDGRVVQIVQDVGPGEAAAK